ncbi:hypothetical protein MNBD_GAMMA24-2024 [hydrothermal vent metagenome]|uniref:Cyclic di-GMP receptor atypical PilZ domain-containing protein n=1 Tax=hydrothermal vent metagenome TaxID=652676 RepID=A0A3B1BID2_9ZZZZ
MQYDVLSIRIALALKWVVLPETTSVASLRRNNLLTFSLLEVLGEQQSTAHEACHSSPELQRIENKLNLLIDMFSKLCGQSQQHTAAILVRLSCKGIEWQSDTAPDEAASLLLELYPDEEMQQTLKIIARVVSVEAHDGRYLVRTRFTSLDEIERNYLEKWIFAHHRRMVAQSRNSSPS